MTFAENFQKSSWSTAQIFFLALGSSFVLEMLSFAGSYAPDLVWMVWIGIVLLAIYLAWRHPPLALCLVLLELVMGGKGYLVSVTVGGQEISLRLGIFLAVFVIWGLRAMRTKEVWGTQRVYKWFWLGILGISLWASFVGIARNHGLQAVFLDANAFLFLGLVPMFGQIKNRIEFVYLLAVTSGALVWLAINTAVAQVVFNHYTASVLVKSWHWVHATGMGEITRISEHLYRIFFQSHIFGLLGFFVGVGLSVQNKHRKVRLWVWRGMATGGLFMVGISLSRSFWLGGIVSLSIGTLTFFCISGLRRRWRSGLKNVLLPVLFAFVAFQWVTNFPFLWSVSGNSTKLVSSRTNLQSEAAASTRRELLPVITKAIGQHPLLGSGFGTAITFFTKDPRVATKDDLHGVPFTTTAFELGYHAFALQFGLPLFTVYITLLGWFFWTALQKIRQSKDGQWTLFGFWLAGIALCVVHLTTPYLNHPLGLGFLLLVASAFIHFPAHAND